MLSRYDLCEPYLIKIAISFCSIICVQCGPDAIQSIISSGIAEQIENVAHVYRENDELVHMVNSLMEEYIYKDIEG